MTGISGIQTAVNTVPAPAVEGDFASANPRFTVLAGPGGYVAGLQGLRIAYFCWESSAALDPDNNPTVLNSFGYGPVTGFVHREQQGLFTTFLATSGMSLRPGMGAVACSGGDFWVTNNGTTYAQKGQKAYADLATGKVSFAATGTPGTVTAATSAVTAPTNAFTGSIADNLLTVDWRHYRYGCSWYGYHRFGCFYRQHDYRPAFWYGWWYRYLFCQHC